MSCDRQNRPGEFSCRCYARLLALYPQAHRRAYGEQMAQLFRDQCREAWMRSGARGLAGLWLRTLPDLFKTSLLEHLAALKGRKSMAEKLAEVATSRRASLKMILRVALPVFLLVFGLSIIVTFLMPEAYSSTARIKIEPLAPPANSRSPASAAAVGYDPYSIQTEFELIQSEAVLSQSIAALDLNKQWGRKYGGGNALRTPDALRILKARLELRPVRNTSLIEIRVFSEDKEEAARIANTIADSYKELRQAQKVQLTQEAVQELVKRFQEQQENIKRTQNELESLRKALGISESEANVSVSSASAATNTLHALEAQLTEASVQLDKSRLYLTKLKELSKSELRQVLPRLYQDPLLTDILAQLNKAEAELARVKRDFAPDHPEFGRVKAWVDGLDKKTDECVTGVMTVLANQLEISEARVASTEKQIADAKEHDVERAVASRPYFDKQRELEQLQSFAHTVDVKLAYETLASTLLKGRAVEIIDRAQPGLRPVLPNKYLNLFLGATGGVMLGLLIGSVAVVTRHLIARQRRGLASV